ncbi:MAG: type II toxin-antitoxin system Phd/YefM family antitoxin [Rhodospirillales bacterium]|jgi:prevent-host-death family protein
MSTAVNLYEAKTQLSSLVERAAKGEEITIAKAGRPLARLVALKTVSKPRKPGLLKGQIRIGPDFDAPLPEGVASAFRGESS